MFFKRKTKMFLVFLMHLFILEYTNSLDFWQNNWRALLANYYSSPVDSEFRMFIDENETLLNENNRFDMWQKYRPDKKTKHKFIRRRETERNFQNFNKDSNINFSPSPLVKLDQKLRSFKKTQSIKPTIHNKNDTNIKKKRKSKYEFSSSSSSKTNNKKLESFSKLDQCTTQQTEASKQKHEDYLKHYLTGSYNSSEENITIGFLSSFTYNKVCSIEF